MLSRKLKTRLAGIQRDLRGYEGVCMYVCMYANVNVSVSALTCVRVCACIVYESVVSASERKTIKPRERERGREREREVILL